MADGLLGSLPVSPPSALTAASTNAAVVNQSTSIWYNFTAFGWAANVTRYAPILEDLVLAGPRMVMKLGSLMSATESIDAGVAQHGSSAAAPHSDVLHSIAADLNISNIIESSFTAADQHDQLAQDPSRLSAATATTTTTTTTTTITTAATDSARGLGSVFSYATSKWALSCMAMAIILNRTYIFAATRRRLRLQWHVRFLLRILPIVLLVSQAQQLLQSIQCQSSPDFSQLRWGAANKSSDLMFSHVNGFLNSMSSTLLFGASDEQSCRAVAMVPTDDTETSRELRGSLSRLWPLFGTFCLSHFLETISCAVQGRAVATETGMTLFEHSVVFAEVDAAASNRFGWGAFSKSSVPNPTSTMVGGAAALTRTMILKRINTSPEVLLIAFLSAMTHISSNVLGIFDLQARYRLLNTGFWGLCFMGSIVWSAFLFDLDNPASQGLLRFPTVCIIRFVPHVLVSIGIVICLLVYGLALMLSALAPPANEEWSRMSLFQRISYAHENMQANISLSEVRITREMDFYTALLRAGFGAITMASEAVYLNEDGGVNLKRHTWLEEARYREAEELQRQWIGMGLLDSRYDQIGAIGLIPVKGSSLGAANGYGRERAAQKVARGRGNRGLRIGIGAAERGSRWLMALEFLLTINKLLARVAALSILWFLRVLRIRARPALLVWLARGSKSPAETDDATSKSLEAANEKAMSETSTLPTEEESPPPPDSFDDVEAEFRHLNRTGDEESLKRDLYKYWLEGGLWGSKDSSADYVPDPEDENWDATSVVTMATSTEQDDETTSGWSSEEGEDDDGQRTPTQRTPTRPTPTQRTPSRTRDNTPFVDSPIGMRDLARLLQPSTAGEREEAEALAAHLQSDRILTRSGFRRMENLQRTRILTMPGPSSSPEKRSGRAGRVVKLSPEEEEQLLEQLLLTRRQISQSEASPNLAPSNQEADGPPCVVCQCAPRTVIVWPCRCLSLCDECRVSLAMNNFDKCVCCRRDVMSFSRIFVP